jgi:long-chain acyl-CoA synthetase
LKFQRTVFLYFKLKEDIKMTTKEVLAISAFLNADNTSFVDTEPSGETKREVTWSELDCQANRFANLLLERGIGRESKIAVLLMNGKEWMAVYSGIIKSGSVPVPIDYRCNSDEIRRCLDISEADALVLGPEFEGRVQAIHESIPNVRFSLYVGEVCPEFAESFRDLTSVCSTRDPLVELAEEEYEYVW